MLLTASRTPICEAGVDFFPTPVSDATTGFPFYTDDEVLFFSTHGIHVTQIGGGPTETLVDPFGAHMKVPVPLPFIGS